GVEPENKFTTPVLSIHALKGSQGHNTMRLAAIINHQEVITLVDLRSTYNFVNHKLTKRLYLPIEPEEQLK
ncbi:hypothetical protein J1N35_011693, partial [Gossypium stocksii]